MTRTARNDGGRSLMFNAAPQTLENVLSAETFDRALLAEFIDEEADDPYGFAISVLGSFLDESSTQMTALRAATDAGDTARVASAAHRLRGGAATLGARRIAQLCAELEAHIRTGPDMAAVASMVLDIEAEWQLVDAACTAERRSLETRGRS
jgi:HPt (histidine-containing phosphotransfer) domain-containing protein